MTVRSLGPLGLAARQRSVEVPRRDPGAAAVHLPQAPAQPARHCCASSTGARRSGSGGRAPSSTPCATTSTATTCAASTGGPPRAAQHVVVRTWQPERDRRWSSSSTPRAPPPAGSTTCPAWTRPWTPPCCSPRWPPGPATGWTCSPATAGSGPGSPAPSRSDAARRPGQRDGAAGAGPGRGRLGDCWPARSADAAGDARCVVLLTPLEPAAIEEGLLPTLPALTPHHRVVLASVARPGARGMAADASAPRHVYDAAAAERTIALRRAHRRACSAASASTSSTRAGGPAGRGWPTTTCC